MTPVVQRYAPFLAIIAMLGLLMVLEPDRATTASTQTTPGGAVVQGTSDSGRGSVASVGPEADGDAPGGAAAGGVGSQGVEAGDAGAGAESGGARQAADATASGQPVDALGRPTDGDRSKCAPGGLLQEDVTSLSLPCMPRFDGNNGGATYEGVTEGEITVAIVVTHFDPAAQQALLAVGLAATDEEYQEASDTFAAFMTKHYELYGREIKPIVYSHDCRTGDNPCYRAEAKAMNAQLKPFAAIWDHQGNAPEAWVDQVSRLGVINLGAPSFPTECFVQRRPYAWTEQPQSPRNGDSIADYYCKKMHGEPASEAGDPTMRAQTRKLGIVSFQEPAAVEMARHIKSQVEGGICGSPKDGTQLYTIASDPNEADQQRPALVARMKNDGITTSLHVPNGDVLGCTECDRQQYFPEHLMAGLVQNDADVVGRLDASSQRNNRFGIGFRPGPHPLPEWDFRRAARDVRPDYEPPLITEGPYRGLVMFGKMVQVAGPNLTPETVERGAHTMAQIGGWENPNPWPGWKCCDPIVVMWTLAGEHNYSAMWDAREIYWSDAATSKDDGQPGAWVCVNNCRRYEAGKWPRGEPKQQ